MYSLIIIEDNMELIEGIEELVDWKSINVALNGSAKNGIIGLELAAEILPDIIITDISMPYMDGLEFMKNLRERNINSKVIVLSGYDNFTYAQKAIRYGAIEYLLKPSKPEEILLSVKKAITIINEEKYNEKLIKNYKERIEECVAPAPQACNQKIVSGSYGIDNKTGRAIVDSAIEYISNNYSEDISLQKVADHIFISPAYLSTLFKQEANINFVDYVHKFRIQKAMNLLKETHYKNYEIASMVGYHDEKYFFQVFKKYSGITPSEYKKLIKENL